MTVVAFAEGFGDPVHDSQRMFRHVLEASAHPGRIVTVAETPSSPPALCAATAAFILTLVDGDTPLWLAPEFGQPEVRDFVRFHTSAPIVEDRSGAVFALLRHDLPRLFDDFAIGTDIYPDRSATLLIEVPALAGGPTLTWRGPGIDGSTHVAIAGLDDGFWQGWSANRVLFPCGVDVVFAAGSQLCALPRSIAVEGGPCMSR